jgi:6-phosphogluconate dehydrogenase
MMANDSRAIIAEKTAAQAFGEPCCDWVGESGSGHYVKMVHNGIEYGDMQLIAEAYDILTRGLGLSAGEIADIFEKVRVGVGSIRSIRRC